MALMAYSKVSGLQVHTEKMQCEWPDYKTRKEPCKHLFAAMLLVKDRGEQTVEHLEGFNETDIGTTKPESKEPSHNLKEVHSNECHRQATITRVAVINSAIELLKTHRKPIELTDVLSLTSQPEQWALGEFHERNSTRR